MFWKAKLSKKQQKQNAHKVAANLCAKGRDYSLEPTCESSPFNSTLVLVALAAWQYSDGSNSRRREMIGFPVGHHEFVVLP
jgi:hypothetical protein